jgi:DNA-binding CsgD family transcriptional regulator
MAPAALGISTDTTGMHVKNIYTKLGVHDRTAAVAKAIRRGIIRIE